MQALNDFLGLIDGYIGGADWFVYFLLGTGAFFTIYLKFPQIRYFRHALRIVRGKYDKEGDEGDTSHFQALATALSGTVGTGNIAGVAFAIHLGGPAALFWMIVTAFFGMTTKFVEVTLSHKYREKGKDGTIAGGPMYFMKNAFNNSPLGPTMKVVAVMFAVATILSSFGTGNMPQINSIASALFTTFDINPMITGAVLAVVLAVVIIGGIKRIAKVTEKLVPGMAIIYFVGALSVIFYNIENVVPGFLSIFSDIFSGTSATGGFLGATFAYAFNRGVNRGLFSNEAGQGSAPIAHAAAKAHEPVSEGLVAILEPFIDTIIICSLTGLVLLSSGVWKEKIDNQFQGSDMTIMAGQYNENNQEDQEKIFKHLIGEISLPVFNGELTVEKGKITDPVSVIHARSIAENVEIYLGAELFSGKLPVSGGNLLKAADQEKEFIVKGKSLVHSIPLTTEAFTRSFFGDYGKYIISIGILLFAFSTAISWSYYGGRATNFLFGPDYVIYYRIAYVLGFFLASFTDTTIIWTLSGITIALMTIPNLVGILLLSGEMKETVEKYWIDFKEEYPEEKLPE